MHIRQENHQDFKAVDTVIQQAFKSAEHSDGNEQNLVSRLRKTSAFIPELSLVAEENNHIIGYILFTKVQIGQTKSSGWCAITENNNSKAIVCLLIVLSSRIRFCRQSDRR